MNATDKQVNSFIEDIKTVLNKHKATLYPLCSSDASGLYDADRLVVMFASPNPSGNFKYRFTDGVSIGEKISFNRGD